METVSPTRLSVYKTCPKQHYYNYKLCLVKKQQPKKHFDKGNYFHELCHVYYRAIQSGIKPGSDLAFKVISDRVQNDLKQNFTPDRLQLFNTILKQFGVYIEKRSPEIDKNIEVLGVEEEIKVPVELPSGRIIYLHGYIDLRYRRDGQCIIRDHKTDSSGQSRAYWQYGGVELHDQLLFYDAAKYIETGEVSWVEVNYALTKDYKNKIPSLEESFGLFTVYHSEKTLKNYLETTLQLIDEMLEYTPTPHYDGEVCKYCPFKLPCIGERSGIPSEGILKAHYVSIDRSKHRERTLTNQNSG